MPPIRKAWGAVSHRWCQEIRELTSVLRLLAGSERPTFDQLKAVGMTISDGTGKAEYEKHDTFNSKRQDGYFAMGVIRKLLQEREVADWKRHHNLTGARPPVGRTWAVESNGKALPGHR